MAFVFSHCPDSVLPIQIPASRSRRSWGLFTVARSSDRVVVFGGAALLSR